MRKCRNSSAGHLKGLIEVLEDCIFRPFPQTWGASVIGCRGDKLHLINRFEEFVSLFLSQGSPAGLANFLQHLPLIMRDPGRCITQCSCPLSDEM